MSVRVIVEVDVTSPARTSSNAAAWRARVHDVVERVARSPSTFRGTTWTWPSERPPYGVGGLFRFDRSLSMPWKAEADSIAKQIHRALQQVTSGEIHVMVGQLDHPDAYQKSEARRSRSLALVASVFASRPVARVAID